MSGSKKNKSPGRAQIRCEDIRDLLFDYMSHELGESRSKLVREHLRKCEECKRQAAEIQSTLDLLKKASKEDTDLPSRLTDERRKKLYWWTSHPVMLWIQNHHALFSAIVTVIIIAILSLILAKAKLWEEDPQEDMIPVWIGRQLPTPKTPALPLDDKQPGESN
jgi:anti-sigma factor RsiW